LGNFVAVGGSFVFGIFNVIGNWFGNLVVAFPDVEVSITDNSDTVYPGANQEYQITLKNRGDAKAKDVNLTFSSSSDFAPSGQLSWPIGELAPDETRTINVQGAISQGALFGSSVMAQADVSVGEDEESLENNVAVDSSLVVALPQSEASQAEDDKTLPQLTISVWNNVGSYIFPGDTILASATITNESGVLAKEVEVKGSLSNDHPMPAIPMQWKLGDMTPGQKVVIKFSIALINDLPEGLYHINVYAEGKSPAGDTASTGLVTSDFLLKLRSYISKLTPSVEAYSEEGVGSGEVLGASSEGYFSKIKKYLPYIFGASIILYLLTSGLRRRLDGKPFFPVFFKRRSRKPVEEDVEVSQ
jgi:hypothetical protein